MRGWKYLSFDDGIKFLYQKTYTQKGIRLWNTMAGFFSEPANLILPGLWLGNAQASQDDTFLRQNNISVVFNCTKDLPFHSTIQRRYRVPVHDNLETEEIRNLELWAFEIVMKIQQEHSAGRQILVHCAAGMQRSAACVALFLMATKGLRREDAIAYIKSKRSIAFYPKANFGPALEGFEKTLQQLYFARNA